MSERVPRPADLSDYQWCSGGATPYTATKPDAAKTAIGWQPKDESPPGTPNPGTAGEIINAPWSNWLHKIAALSVRWLDGFTPREFESITEALAADDSYGRRFVIYPATRSHYPGYPIYSKQGSGGALAVAELVTDGQRLYYRQATDFVYACTIDDPDTDLWSLAADTALALIATDGRYLYVGDQGVAGVWVIDPSDGSLLGTLADHTGGSPTYPSVMAGSGQFFCCVDASDQAKLEMYTLAEGAYAPTYWAGHDMDAHASTAIHGVTIRSESQAHYAYVIWTDGANTEYHLSKIRIWTIPAVAWTVNLANLWATLGAAPNAIASDGEAIYVGTNRAEVTAGVYGAVHAFSPFDGAWLWSRDLGAGVDADKLCCDHRHVIATDAAAKLSYQLRSVDGHAIRQIPHKVFAADGVAVIASNFADTDKITRLSLGYHAQEFAVVNPDDYARKPFYHVVVPLR